MELVKLRKMLAEDLEAVMDIEYSCFTVPWSKEAFLMEIEKNIFARYFVVEFEGKIVGYGGMWMIMDEAHVTNIAVIPDFRGKGFGKKLVEILIHTANEEGIQRLTLEVRKSNEEAQNLYKKYGFNICGCRPRYYQDNDEDAMIMWKE